MSKLADAAFPPLASLRFMPFSCLTLVVDAGLLADEAFMLPRLARAAQPLLAFTAVRTLGHAIRMKRTAASKRHSSGNSDRQQIMRVSCCAAKLLPLSAALSCLLSCLTLRTVRRKAATCLVLRKHRSGTCRLRSHHRLHPHSTGWSASGSSRRHRCLPTPTAPSRRWETTSCAGANRPSNQMRRRRQLGAPWTWMQRCHSTWRPQLERRPRQRPVRSCMREGCAQREGALRLREEVQSAVCAGMRPACHRRCDSQHCRCCLCPCLVVAGCGGIAVQRLRAPSACFCRQCVSSSAHTRVLSACVVVEREGLAAQRKKEKRRGSAPIAPIERFEKNSSSAPSDGKNKP